MQRVTGALRTLPAAGLSAAEKPGGEHCYRRRSISGVREPMQERRPKKEV